MRITQMGNGWVVDVEGCGQRVFTSTKECEAYVGSVMISKITVADYTQVEITAERISYMLEEAKPVAPDIDEY